MSLKPLTNKPVLWSLFAITLLITIGFVIVMQVWGFLLIDEMFKAEQIAEHIGGMSEEQKQAHIWTTATLDVLYPLAYGSLFTGIALKAFGRAGIWLALPSLLCIPVDLSEGYAQVMLLAGNTEFMGLKTIVTPIKFALLLAGLVISVVGVVRLYRCGSG